MFSNYVLQALRGEAARTDGRIWVNDLFSYVSKGVLQHKHQPQHPYQKSVGEDFVVWVQVNTIQRKQCVEGIIPPEIDQRSLRRAMREAYNRAEIEVLCQDLNLSFDDLSDHRPLETQIMELIEHCRRHKLYNQLLERVQADRPGIAVSQ